MKKNKWNNVFKNHYGVPKKSKIAYYKNPNECNHFHFERVNPDHIGLIWGHRKNKSGNWIRIAKVWIMGLFGTLFNKFIEFLEWFSANIDLYACIYYIFIALVIYAIIFNIPFIENLILCIKK